MAKEPGFFSTEGFPYPLLALGQAIPRGYQYQSQMTPYKRDARGDWGRAINESIDQFFGMYPQFLQQKRAFALQRDQLARQRASDLHTAKLRPFELKQAQATQKLSDSKMQMLENYPALVEQLPVDDKYKAYLKSVPPAQGFKIIQDHIAKMMKGKTKMIKAGQPTSDGQTFPVDLQQKDDGTLIKSPVPTKKTTYQPGETLPDGTVNNTPRPIQISADNTIFAPLGTTAQKKIVELSKYDSRKNNFPEHQRPFLKLDMTQGGEGVVILDPAASSMAEEMITVPPGGLYPDGKTVNNLQTPVQVSRSGKLSAPLGTTTPDNFVPVPEKDARLGAYPQSLHKYLHINKKNNSISFHPSFTREMQQLVLKEARPIASDRFKTFQKENPEVKFKSFADLGRWTGTSQESKLWFATQNLPPDHPLHIDAQNQLNLKHVKITPNAIIVGRGFKDPNKPDAAKRLPEPTTEEIETGDSVSALAKRFGTTESQIIAANPDWFDKDINGKADTKSMRTSEQMEGAEMIIPTGKSNLSPSQIREAHSSKRRAGVTEMPYGTIIPIRTATVGDGLKLNTERLDMQNIQTSIKDLVTLIDNPKARGFGKMGTKERGQLEGLRQRLINNVQVLRDYGVLSPSEIQNIERSVPDLNGFIQLVTRGLGSDEFTKGILNTLYTETINRERQLKAMIDLYGAPITDYERFVGDIPGLNAGQGGEGNQNQSAVDAFRSN